MPGPFTDGSRWEFWLIVFIVIVALSVAIGRAAS